MSAFPWWYRLRYQWHKFTGADKWRAEWRGGGWCGWSSWWHTTQVQTRYVKLYSGRVQYNPRGEEGRVDITKVEELIR